MLRKRIYKWGLDKKKNNEPRSSVSSAVVKMERLRQPPELLRGEDDLDEESEISTIDEGSAIFSSDPETSATASSLTTGGISNIAADELVSLFLRHNEMQVIFEKASCNDDLLPRKFERKFRSLLNEYSLKLKYEARGVDEIPAAALVRRRSRYIAHVIREKIGQPTDLSQLQLENHDGIIDRQLQIEQYLQGLKANTDEKRDNIRTRTDPEIDDDSDESEDGWAHDLHDNVPALSAVLYFLIESDAFVELCVKLWDLVEPSVKLAMNSVSTELEAAGNGFLFVQVCTGEAVCPLPFCKETWSNRCKRAVENYTNTAWDWWPLQQCRPKLNAGFKCLHWRCACGEDRYETVPTSFAKQIVRKRRLQLGGSPASNPQLPAQNRVASPPTNHSLSPSQYVPPNLSKSLQSDPESGQTSALNLSDGGQRAKEAVNISTEFGLHVLVNVPVGDNLHIKRIDILDYRDDRFFEQLRAAYASAKGKLRRIFGIWTYSHCKFFKFEKFDVEGIAPCGPGIPAPNNQDYQYRPKPVEKMPPITKHEFKRRFYACYQHCFPAIFNPFHQCWKPCQHSLGAVDRLPKRVRPLELGGDAREIFWGLYVVEHICFYRVAAFHTIVIMPALVFWFLWLFYWGHSGDLQNASVPFLCALGIISLFWYPLYGGRSVLDTKHGNRRES